MKAGLAGGADCAGPNGQYGRPAGRIFGVAKNRNHLAQVKRGFGPRVSEPPENPRTGEEMRTDPRGADCCQEQRPILCVSHRP